MLNANEFFLLDPFFSRRNLKRKKKSQAKILSTIPTYVKYIFCSYCFLLQLKFHFSLDSPFSRTMYISVACLPGLFFSWNFRMQWRNLFEYKGFIFVGLLWIHFQCSVGQQKQRNVFETISFEKKFYIHHHSILSFFFFILQLFVFPLLLSIQIGFNWCKSDTEKKQQSSF